MIGYALIKDIHEQPILVIKADAVRTLFAQSKTDIISFTLALLVFGLILVGAILFLLERMVLSRFGRLSSDVTLIGQPGNSAARISISGKDEVSNLANNINSMLDTLDESKKLRQESEAFNSALLHDSPNPVEVLNPDGSIRYVNPAFENITGYSQEQLIGRNVPFPWWPEENFNQYTAKLQEDMDTGTETQERHYQRNNGEPFWVELTSTPQE